MKQKSLFKERVLSLVLCIVLSLSICALPASATSNAAEEASESLYSLGLFRGTGTRNDGTPIFDLDKIPTRGQAVIMLVRLLGKEAEAMNYTQNDYARLPFTDVSSALKPYVLYAYEHGLTNGISNTKYGSGQNIRANQYVSFVLRALGYVSGRDFSVSDPWELSDSIGLTHGEYNVNTTSFTRGDVAIISNNALSVYKNNSSQTLMDYLNETGFGRATIESFQYLTTYYYGGTSYYSGAYIEGINRSTFNGKTEYYMAPGWATRVLAVAIGAMEIKPSDNPFLAGDIKINNKNKMLDEYHTQSFYGPIQYDSVKEKMYSPITFQEITINHTCISYNGITIHMDESTDNNYTVHIRDGVKTYANDNHYYPHYYVCINDLLKAFNIQGEFQLIEVGEGTMAWTLK